MGIATFPPGTSIRLHSHNTIEQVTVLEGEVGALLLTRRSRPVRTTRLRVPNQRRETNVGVQF